MKLFNLLAATTLTLASVAAPAFAGVYRFNKYAGNIYEAFIDHKGLPAYLRVTGGRMWGYDLAYC